MVKNFNKKAKNYEKTICAAISILAFLVIWQLVVSFTKAGMVLAGPIDTLSMFVISIVKPLGTHTIEGHILWSLSRVLVGFIIGSVLGIVLGILMVFITHDLTSITYLCDRVVFIDAGTIVEQVDDIRCIAMIRNDYARNLLGSVMGIGVEHGSGAARTGQDRYAAIA